MVTFLSNVSFFTFHSIQPYDANRMILNIEKFLSGKNQSSQDKDKDKNDSNYATAQEILKAKLTLVKIVMPVWTVH